MIRVDVANGQSRHEVDQPRLCAAIEAVLCAEGVATATISLAIVDDGQMQSLNRRWLSHDYPTDVLSFVLEQAAGSLDGEIIVSVDTAAAAAAEFGWSIDDELLLYVIHGVLHLVGYDDHEPADRQRMRNCERDFLGRFGLALRDEDAQVPHRASLSHNAAGTMDGGKLAEGKTAEGSQP